MGVKGRMWCGINPRRASAVKVTVVGSVYVCMLVPKLASRMFVRAKIDTAYSTGDADRLWHYL